MKANRGLGLSANQCGLPYRVFVLWSEKPFVCFNPRIIDKTSETTMLEEGCLSFPHLIVKIKRPSAIKVRFQDAFGEMHTEKFTGMTARAFQHELDHMDGVTYHTRANKIHLERALNQQKNLVRQLKRGEVIIRPTSISTTEQDIKNAQLSITTTDRVVDLASEVKL
jgi:peptide deformylase